MGNRFFVFNSKANTGQSIQSSIEQKSVPEANTGCWNWVGAYDKDGYGLVQVSGKLRRAHRVSYEVYSGKTLSKDVCIMHSCDNPSCVSPYHLSEGNNKANQIDASKKGRHAHQRLTKEQAGEIRKRYLSGEGPMKLSREFKITCGYVINIGKSKKWAHI